VTHYRRLRESAESACASVAACHSRPRFRGTAGPVPAHTRAMLPKSLKTRRAIGERESPPLAPAHRRGRSHRTARTQQARARRSHHRNWWTAPHTLGVGDASTRTPAARRSARIGDSNFHLGEDSAIESPLSRRENRHVGCQKGSPTVRCAPRLCSAAGRCPSPRPAPLFPARSESEYPHSKRRRW